MKLRLLAVLAHPDDESLGFGGTLARYAAEGVETYLVTATRGERGRFGSLGKSGDPVEVGRVREAELREAAAVLGIREVSILSYPDGAVDEVPAAIAIRAIASHIRRIQPHVIVTFGPDGAYGHPDHIAVSQFTTAAAVCAADTAYRIVEGSQTDPPPPHRVQKLFYLAWRNDKWEAYQAAFRRLTSMVDGIQRQAAPWPDWAVTTGIDTSAYWTIVWKAVCCHQTQLSIYERLGTSLRHSIRHFGAHKSSIVSTARSTVDENLRPTFLKGYGKRICLLIFDSINLDPAPLLSR